MKTTFEKYFSNMATIFSIAKILFPKPDIPDRILPDKN
jgi:hypothetical protein